MGMDLHGAGGYFRFDVIAWAKVLELARQYGWEPAGTELPEEDWNGGYDTNAFQRVTDEDAANIAAALERALDDVPDFSRGGKTKEYTPEDPPTHPVMRALVMAVGGPLVGPDDSPSPVEFFAGVRKDKIREYIAFCRAGGFVIT